MFSSTNIINVYGQYPNHTYIEKKAVQLVSKIFPIIGCVCLKTQLDPKDIFEIVGNVQNEFYLIRIYSQKEYIRDVGLTPIIGWMEKSDFKYITNIVEPIFYSANSLLDTSLQFLGTPYLWGGKSKDATDCSGLTYQIYRQHGIILPRFCWGQYKVTQPIDPSNLEIGDFVFICSGEQNKPIHVLIYIGLNNFKSGECLLEACGLPGVFTTRLITFQERWGVSRNDLHNGSFISEKDKIFFHRII